MTLRNSILLECGKPIIENEDGSIPGDEGDGGDAVGSASVKTKCPMCKKLGKICPICKKKAAVETKYSGFKKVASDIAKKQGKDKKQAAAILAAKTRNASPEAKSKNPNLNKVK